MVSRSAFTLVEILVTVSIIALVILVPILSVSAYQRSARDTRRLSDIGQIQQALESYKENTGVYPNSLPDLVTEGYMAEVPQDPLIGTSVQGTEGVEVYNYQYTPTQNNSSYILRVPLEEEGDDGVPVKYLIATPTGTTRINGTPTPAGPGGGGNITPMFPTNTQVPTLTQTPTVTPTSEPTIAPELDLPDLVVQSITRDASDYTITYCNQGESGSTDLMTVQLYRVTSPNPSGTGWQRNTDLAVPDPAQCDTTTVPRCFSSESGGGCSTTITVRATVNYYQFQLVESDYTNNSLEESF